LFGGPVVGAAAAVVCSLYLPGLGSNFLLGAAINLFAAGFGIGFYFLRARYKIPMNGLVLLGLGVLLHLMILGFMLIFPGPVEFAAVDPFGLLVMLLYPTVFMCASLFFLDLETYFRDREDALKNEIAMRNAQRVAHVGSWAWYIQQDRLEWSDEMYRIFGIDRAKFTGKLTDVIDKAIHPDDREAVNESNRNVAEQGRPSPLKYRIIWPDGSVHAVWAEAGELIRNNNGTPDVLTGIVQDITERELLLETLSRTEERWQFALEGAGDGVWDWNAQTNEVFFSRQWKAMLGYQDDEIKDSLEEWTNRIHPADREQCFAGIQRYFDGKTPTYQNEHRILCKDGSYKWILDRGKVVTWTEDHKPLRVIGTHSDISENKKISEKLAESEAHYRALVEGTPGIIYSFSSRRGGIYYSPNVLNILGYTPEQLLSQPNLWHDSIHPDDLSRVDQSISEAVNDKPYEIEYRIRDAQGNWLWFADRSIRYAIENTEVIIDGLVLDISERKKIEEALRSSHDLLARLAEQVPGFFFQFHLNPDGRSSFPFASPGLADIFELSPEQVREDAAPLFERIHSQDHDRFLAALQESAQVLQLLQVEFRVILPRKGLCWRICHAKPERKEDGSTLWYGIITDITDRKIDELRINDQIHELRRWHVAMLGREKRTVELKKEVNELLLQAEKPARYNALEVNEAQLTQQLQKELIGRRMVEPGKSISAKELQRLLNEADESRQVLLSVIEDQKITEEKLSALNAELEERVHDRTIQLETANKEMEAFSYSVSHDLRAPLRGIDGWSLALVEDYYEKLDDKARLYLTRVRDETQRMGQLIDDLLRLSRITRQDMQHSEINLSALAGTIVERIQAEDAQRSVNVAIQPGLTAMGDPKLLEIVLTNLLANAYKFTGKQPEPYIQFGKTVIDGKAAYFIKDNGAGFDMEQAKNLFGAFQRMHRQTDFPGTGIGLATVQRIIHRHGGQVWADAKKNQGATFYFTLDENN
jgi:PAS domain S-box-containing protein